MVPNIGTRACISIAKQKKFGRFIQIARLSSVVSFIREATIMNRSV